MIPKRFTHQLRNKKTELQRSLHKAQETDFELSDALTRKIELINILLAEFGSFAHPRSLKNLLKRPDLKKA